MTGRDLDPETCAAAAADDPRLQAAVDAVEADAEQFAQYLAGHVPIAIRRAVVEGATAVVSPVIADRLRRILLHPIAGLFWEEAQAMAFDLDVPAEKAVAALDALAGTGGGRTAN